MITLYPLPLLYAYFVGSLPVGYWFAHYFFNIDIKAHGSGNIGATNIGRTLGIRYFFLIFFADALKAYCVLYYYSLYNTPPNLSIISLLLAIALLLGNRFSLFLALKGGKGVATSAGIVYALAPQELFFISALAWIITFSLTKRAYLASLVTSCTCVIASTFIAPSKPLFFLLVFITLWLFGTHLDNIKKEFKQ